MTTHPFSVAAACLAALLLAPGEARAQGGPCLPHDQAVERLVQKYQERPAGIGVVGGGRAMIELYVSERGTWTILVTQANGLACITAAGDGWQVIEPQYGVPL